MESLSIAPSTYLFLKRRSLSMFYSKKEYIPLISSVCHSGGMGFELVFFRMVGLCRSGGVGLPFVIFRNRRFVPFRRSGNLGAAPSSRNPFTRAEHYIRMRQNEKALHNDASASGTARRRMAVAQVCHVADPNDCFCFLPSPSPLFLG